MRQSRGFSLLEILIVVTVISAIATIAIPNLLKAIDRSRRSTTLTDMRTVGDALERYAVDHLAYPDAAGIEALRPELEPDYVKQLPATDGWGHPFVFEAGEEGATYTLLSPGKDGLLQPSDPAEAARDFAADIVLVDGVFMQRPASRPGEAEDEGRLASR